MIEEEADEEARDAVEEPLSKMASRPTTCVVYPK